MDPGRAGWVCQQLTDTGQPCLAEIKVGQKFCYNCGTATPFCSNCAAPLPAEANFCGECGKRRISSAVPREILHSPMISSHHGKSSVSLSSIDSSKERVVTQHVAPAMSPFQQFNPRRQSTPCDLTDEASPQHSMAGSLVAMKGQERPVGNTQRMGTLLYQTAYPLPEVKGQDQLTSDGDDTEDKSLSLRDVLPHHVPRMKTQEEQTSTICESEDSNLSWEDVSYNLVQEEERRGLTVRHSPGINESSLSWQDVSYSFFPDIRSQETLTTSNYDAENSSLSSEEQSPRHIPEEEVEEGPTDHSSHHECSKPALQDMSAQHVQGLKRHRGKTTRSAIGNSSSLSSQEESPCHTPDVKRSKRLTSPSSHTEDSGLSLQSMSTQHVPISEIQDGMTSPGSDGKSSSRSSQEPSPLHMQGPTVQEGLSSHSSPDEGTKFTSQDMSLQTVPSLKTNEGMTSHSNGGKDGNLSSQELSPHHIPEKKGQETISTHGSDAEDTSLSYPDITPEDIAELNSQHELTSQRVPQHVSEEKREEQLTTHSLDGDRRHLKYRSPRHVSGSMSLQELPPNFNTDMTTQEILIGGARNAEDERHHVQDLSPHHIPDKMKQEVQTSGSSDVEDERHQIQDSPDQRNPDMIAQEMLHSGKTDAEEESHQIRESSPQQAPDMKTQELLTGGSEGIEGHSLQLEELSHHHIPKMEIQEVITGFGRDAADNQASVEAVSSDHLQRVTMQEELARYMIHGTGNRLTFQDLSLWHHPEMKAQEVITSCRADDDNASSGQDPSSHHNQDVKTQESLTTDSRGAESSRYSPQNPEVQIQEALAGTSNVSKYVQQESPWKSWTTNNTDSVGSIPEVKMMVRSRSTQDGRLSWNPSQGQSKGEEHVAAATVVDLPGHHNNKGSHDSPRDAGGQGRDVRHNEGEGEVNVTDVGTLGALQRDQPVGARESEVESLSEESSYDHDTVDTGDDACHAGQENETALVLTPPPVQVILDRNQEAVETFYYVEYGQERIFNRTLRVEKPQEESNVLICFRVIIHPDFKYHRKDATVYISCQISGRHNDFDVELHEVQTLEDNYVHMTATIALPVADVSQRRFFYSYYLYRHDNHEIIEEHFAGLGTRQNRYLYIPPHKLVAGSWTRYDGVILREPTRYTRAKNWFGIKDYEFMTELAVRTWMPTWEGLCVSDNAVQGYAWRTILEIQDLNQAVKEWTIPLDTSKRTTCFCKVLMKVIQHRLDTFKQLKEAKKEIKHDAVVRLAAAITIVQLRDIYDLNFSQKHYKLLLEALLLRPDNKECPDFKGLIPHHFREPSQLGSLLAKFIRLVIAKHNKEHKWMWCVPLLHALTGVCQPFETPHVYYSKDHRNQDWWGSAYIDADVQVFRKNFQSHDEGIMSYMKKVLTPLFSVDKMLPRTLLAGLSKVHLRQIVTWPEMPPEAVLAMVFFLIETEEVAFSEIKETLKRLEPLLTHFKNRDSQHTVHQLQVICSVAIDIVESVMAKSISTVMEPDPSPVLAAIELCAQMLILKSQFSPQGKQSDMEDQLSCRIIQWMHCWLPQDMLKDNKTTLTKEAEPQVWTHLLNLCFGDEAYTDNWRSRVKEDLDVRISQISIPLLLQFFASNMKELNKHPVLLEKFSCKALVSAQDAFGRGGQELECLFGNKNGAEAGKLLSKVLCECWEGTLARASSVLDHIIQLPCVKYYLNAYNSPVSGVLTGTCKTYLEVARAVLSNFIQDLLSGEVLVSHVTMAPSAHGTLIQLLEAGQLWNEKVPSQDSFLKLLALRARELAEFERTKENITDFLFLCNKLERIEVSWLVSKMKADVSNMMMSKLVKPIQFSDDDDACHQEMPNVTFFKMPPNLIRILSYVPNVKRSFVFCQIWETSGRWLAHHIAQHDVHSLAFVTDNVWPFAYKQWCRLGNELAKNTITISEVEAAFTEILHREELVKSEIHLMSPSLSDVEIEQRITQLNTWKSLLLHQGAARLFQRAKRTLHLTGNFDNIEHILAVTADRYSMLSSITEDMVSAGAELENINKESLACLETFIKCQPLIEWLKENVPGPQDLAAFVDMALSAVNSQDGLTVTKVSSLHAAVSGFTPLIYDLRPDSGFVAFYTQCQTVWRMLQADQDLPKKLMDLNTDLKWLKDLREVQGDVGVNALKEVAAINARGIFIVGREKGSTPKTVADMLRLEVVGEGKRQSYKMDALRELHSRLMLVMGQNRVAGEKGTEGLDAFVEIFDSITALAASLIEMTEAGNVLFDDWNAKFYCSTDISFTTIIDFGLSEKKLLGYQEEMSVCEQIKQVREFMDRCLTEWKKYMAEKRCEFPELNHFTSSQLVLLRREFATLVTGDVTVPIPQTVLMLLHPLRDSFTLEHLREAFRNAMRVLKDQQDEELQNGVGEKSSWQSEEDRILWELSKRYNRASVQRAIEKHGIENVDEIELDCMEDQDLVFVAREAPLLEGETVEEATDRFLQLLDPRSSQLSGRLGELWTNYLQSTSSGMSNFLSVDQLGLTLKSLSQQPQLNRPVPIYLQEGRPNLLVCPEAEVLDTALALYMENTNLPLPQRDEVLLCTAETGVEEVQLLLRRAAQDKSGRIFTLCHAELLPYEAAAQVEETITSLLLGVSQPYRLVVVCSCELQHTSMLVTALDNYHVQRSIAVSAESISHYLLQGLQAAGEGLGTYLDPEQSSIRIISSHQAGDGKSLWVSRRRQEIDQRDLGMAADSLPLHGRTCALKDVIQQLQQRTLQMNERQPRMFHIDIGPEMEERWVQYFLFNLIILGSISDPSNYPWHRSQHDYYVIEIQQDLQKTYDHSQPNSHHLLTLLPTTICRSPSETLMVLQAKDAGDEPVLVRWSPHDQCLDEQVLQSEPFQRVFGYLWCLEKKKNLRRMNPSLVQASPRERLELLLQYCGLRQVTWAEIGHFIHFLNVQLTSCENSNFCSPAVEAALPGFLTFVVRFMITMSKDFATRSMKVSPKAEVPQGQEIPDQGSVNEEHETLENAEDADLADLRLERRWETSDHPYIFFNPDQETMTFQGFTVTRPTIAEVDPETKEVSRRPIQDAEIAPAMLKNKVNLREKLNLIDPQNDKLLEENIMQANLYCGLYANSVNLSEDFDKLPRSTKLAKMRMVMGVTCVHDPDENYVLTTDNVKKMLAIYMRFRCAIPVIIMGETGCGKTRLVRFMCQLQVPKDEGIDNMVQVKVHGGMADKDLIEKIKEAETLAIENSERYPGIITVLFLDEVNTTEALGVVKELLCDGTVNGQALDSSLKLVAACNPYRKHTPEVIHRLEQAGLGYHIQADETQDKLGRIPMRQLVYRVQPLPQSLRPLVWDFGQLLPNVEKLYIQKIVERKLMSGSMGNVPETIQEIIVNILMAAQAFMRNQQDECSFVSLRDVERTLVVMEWFFTKCQLLFHLMNEEAQNREQEAWRQQHLLIEIGDMDEEREASAYRAPSDMSRALILALGVSYHASLQDSRESFREHVAGHFQGDLQLSNGAQTIAQEISLCQDVLLASIELGPNIARNHALKENIFMMVVCIQLKIPLFLVGKPGSSKSLAKTIVANTMLGPYSPSELFRQFKQVCMVPYQCSPHSTPDGIGNIFHQCAQLQKDNHDLEKFVAVVVLEEVGLAEDSPRMPLKTLHPLLEDGCQGNEKPEEYKKVGFIGISNWALDPAKMNRGILVQRASPDESELRDTAEGICVSDKAVLHEVAPLMSSLATAYSYLFDFAVRDKREFFGLRDFYSLVKMVFTFAKKNGKKPTWHQIEHAVLRNFGGLQSANPVQIFSEYIHDIDQNTPAKPGDPDNSPTGLIMANLNGEGSLKGESRYLLILTENYSALPILEQKLEALRNATIIFGSSFPKDQDYVVVCSDINRIKVCMELGQTVVLLNLEKLYESLYDALNQYYTTFGGQQHVDIGLGSHRVKARVHKDFRMLVVAEKDDVYKKFPIPLINRLEKHFVATSTILTLSQQQLVEILEEWLQGFTQETGRAAHHHARRKMVGDVIIGYHTDACATAVVQACTELGMTEGDDTWAVKVLEMSKKTLLWCAVPEALVCLKQTRLSPQADEVQKVYMVEQNHNSLTEVLTQKLLRSRDKTTNFIQVTTHSRLLSRGDVPAIAAGLGLPSDAVHLQSLPAFNTEQQFSLLVREFFNMQVARNHILMIQCDCTDQTVAVINCARHIIWDEYQHMLKSSAVDAPSPKDIVLIIHLPRVAGGSFTGFQGCGWQSVHLDELCPKLALPSLLTLTNSSVSSIWRQALPEGLMVQHADEANKVGEGDPSPREGEEDESRIDEVRERNDQARNQMIQDQEQKLDLISMLRLCTHAAAAMLKDNHSELNITRVQLLLALLTHNGGDNRFSKLLQLRVYMLLRDKEKSTMIESTAKTWLSVSLSSTHAISVAGTFRRCTWQALEARVTPVLAAILSLIDVSSNLQLLPRGDSWIQAMWLNVFANPELTPLKYSDLLSPKLYTELRERVVPSVGAAGSRMVVTLPFSWLLKNQVDRLVVWARQSQGKEQMGVTIANLLVKSAWWPILEAACQEAGMEALLSRYMRDFVCMVYAPQPDNADQEIKLVIRALDSVVKQLIRQSTSNQQHAIEYVLPMIHEAHSAIQRRLQLFSQLVQQHPDIIVELGNFLSNHPEDPLASEEEMTLEVLAITLLVERIKPTEKLLRNVDEIRRWQQDMEQMAPLVSDALAMVQRMEHLGVGQYGEICETALKVIQKEWSRLSTVKLFASTVCPEGSDQHANINHFCPLLHRKLMEIDVDFKSEETMRKVDNFLRLLTNRIMKQYLSTCPLCKELKVDMLRLSCGHLMCQVCIDKLKFGDDNTCTVCRQEYTSVTTTEDESREQVQKMTLVKQRCNAFLLEVVSKMCFAGSSPPEAAVIQLLMTYVTGTNTAEERNQTKPMGLFNEQWDNAPVIRSALLQLLLRSSLADVRDYVQDYFDKASELMVTKRDQVELRILYVQCLEDHFHMQAVSNLSGEDAILNRAAELLQESHDDLASENHLVTLEAIAKVRFGLSIAAHWIAERPHTAAGSVRPEVVENLIMASRRVCEQANMEGPCVFLARIIARCFGLDTLLTVARVRNQQWILSRFTNVEEVPRPDRFVIFGDAYARTRCAITTSLSEGQMEIFSALIQKEEEEDGNSTREMMGRWLLIALSRHVTMSFADRKKPQPQMIAQLQETIAQAGPWLNKDLAAAVIENTVAVHCPQLTVTSDLSCKHLDVIEIVHHFIASLPILNTKQLLQPLALLASNPAAAQGWFLPTMPEDTRVSIHNALKAAAVRHENPSLYECPNGHPYFIGNCGRPTTSWRCIQCGLPVGGENYKLAPGNRRVTDFTDKTKPGHVLGAVSTCCSTPAPERTLTPASNTLLRLLLHLSLFTAANKQQGVQSLITPVIDEAEVSDFLWQHLLHDLAMLGQALDKGVDDMVLLVHLLIHRLCTQPDIDCPYRALLTKADRETWETMFASHFLIPLLSEADIQLQDANRLIANDEGVGNLGLLRLIHEVDAPPVDVDPQQVETVPAIWRFRKRITLEHLRQALSESQAQHGNSGQPPHALLSLFLEKETILREVQKLPNLIHLTTWVIQYYQWKIDRYEAETLRMRDFIGSLPRVEERHEAEYLLKDLQTAWLAVRSQLRTHVFSGQVLPPEYCDIELGWDTSVNVLLPSLRGMGRCIVALLHYLTTFHNEFMMEYTRISQQRLGPEVNFPELRAAHLVSYNVEADLLPMVMANCNYSLEVGQGTSITYNLGQLEQQLEETLLRGKAGVHFQLESVVFHEDLTNAMLYNQLAAKIPQVSLPDSTKKQICREVRFVVEVSDCLAQLDIAVGFLVSVGGQPDTMLHSFLVDTLQMDATVLMTGARNHCQLQHLRDLWLLLSHHREKMIVRCKQEPLTSVNSDDYKVALSRDQEAALQASLHKMDGELLLDILYEFIILCLTLPKDKNDEDYVDNRQNKLSEMLSMYIDEREGHEIPGLHNLPDSLKVEQSVTVWIATCNFNNLHLPRLHRM